MTRTTGITCSILMVMSAILAVMTFVTGFANVLNYTAVKIDTMSISYEVATFAYIIGVYIGTAFWAIITYILYKQVRK